MPKQRIVFGDIKQEIDKIVQQAAGNRLNIAYRIYNVIASASGYEGEALEYFYESSEEVKFGEQNPAEEVFDAGEQYQLAKSYGKMIDGALEALIRQNLPCKEFYEKLWDYIAHDTILTGKKEKVFALYYIWIDVRIPYFELDQGLKMSNDVYRELVIKLKPLIKKARFILYAPTDQKTERASRILKLLDELQDDKEKAVLMALVLGMIEKRSEAVLERGGRRR